ncbi:MAG: septal ring lytic transglycosylase RlpA family protein [Burkholderiales bacterium]|nr:septal ring lytic transglycosylase RlpA family protein [Burkholderiales bacterium]
MLRAGPAARYALLLALSALLTACGSSPRAPERQATPSTAPQQPGAPAKPAATAPKPKPPADASSAQGPRRGAYYQDDGPGDTIPPNLEATPDAVPGDDPPLRSAANRPYTVFGRTYTPLPANADLRQRGIGSWYGRKFHGQRTSSGEIYDMFAMTAAHPTLPLPSWVRVTNPANARSVVVKVNDRGPFHSDRIIDLSYTAALKLGYVNQGSALVEVERVRASDVGARPARPAVAAAPPRSAPEQPPAAPAPAAPPPQPAPQTELPPPKPATVVLSTSTQPDGVYLQLGAFGAAPGAEEFRIKTYQQLPWLTETIYIVSSGNLHRVQLGPYADRAAAQAIADRIRDSLQLRAVFVVR